MATRCARTWKGGAIEAQYYEDGSVNVLYYGRSLHDWSAEEKNVLGPQVILYLADALLMVAGQECKSPPPA